MPDVIANGNLEIFDQTEEERKIRMADHEYFQEKDAKVICQRLEKNLRPLRFGEYLKRYLYVRGGLVGPLQEIPLKDYQMMIIDAFRDHQTPPSFAPTTVNLNTLSEKWLTRQTVRRRVVLLLGFGLGMSERDVNDFLSKALYEPVLNILDPMETVCMYCYQHGYGYYKYEQLMKVFEQTGPNRLDMKKIYDLQPAGRPESVQGLQNDAKLMAYLVSLKTEGSSARSTGAAFASFRRLYDQARKLIAEEYNAESIENEQNRQQRSSVNRRLWTGDSINERDLEHAFCFVTPGNRNENLTPARKSMLSAQFEGKRFSRRHINEILRQYSGVERFDLITLNFLIHAKQTDLTPDARERYSRFIRSTNLILDGCGMEPICVTNPYECFVLMCILSPSPLESYADVMEISYDA